MIRRFISFALLLTLAIGQAGCMTAPRPIASPRTFIPLRKPDRVWLTDQDGNRTVVVRPRAMGDTLFGRTMDGEEVWIAFSDVPRLEARQMDKGKTFGLIGGGIAAGVAIFALMTAAGGGADKDDLDRPEMSIVLFRR